MGGRMGESVCVRVCFTSGITRVLNGLVLGF